MKTKIFSADTSFLSDKNIFDCLYNSVSSLRKSKVDLLRSENARRLSLGAGLLLGRALESMGFDKTEFDVSFGKHGKPFFTDKPEICFSLSHSGERVMCALSDVDVGCDVELVRAGREKTAKRFFTDEENSLIDSASSSNTRLEMFFRIWTLKESFIKTSGSGFSISPTEFSISIKGKQICVLQNIFKNDFHFREYGIRDGYCYSCCALNEDFDDMIYIDLSK